MSRSPFAAVCLLLFSACGGTDFKDVQPAMLEMMPLLTDLAQVEMITQNRNGQRIVNYKSVPADSVLSGVDTERYARFTQILDRSAISTVRVSRGGVAFTTNGWIDAEAGFLFVRVGDVRKVAAELLGQEVAIESVHKHRGWYSFFVD